MPCFRNLTIVICLIALITSGAIAGEHATARITTSRYNKVRQIQFSFDGKYVAVLTDHRLHFVDSANGRVIRSVPSRYFNCVFTRDSKWLTAIGRHDTDAFRPQYDESREIELRREHGNIGITLLKSNGKLIVDQVIPAGPAAMNGNIKSGAEIVAVSSNGRSTSTVGMSTSRVLELLSGFARTKVELKYIPKGELDVSTETLTRFVVDRSTGTEVYRKPGANKTSESLLLCSTDGVYQIVQATDGRVLSMLELERIKDRSNYTFSPDSKHVAFFGTYRDTSAVMLEGGTIVNSAGRGIELHDTSTGKMVSYFSPNFLESGSPCRIKFLNSKYLALGGRSRIAVYDIGTGLEKAAVDFTEDENHRRPVNSFDANAKRRIYAVGSSGGRVSLISLTGKVTHDVLNHSQKESIDGTTISPDGKVLAYVQSGTLHVVNIADLKLTKQDDGKRLAKSAPGR